MGKYLEEYCLRPDVNSKSKLEKIIDKLMKKHFPWVTERDMDEFYSIGYIVAWNCEKRFSYKENVKFSTFLTFCLLNKIKTQITYMNRDKRCLKDKSGECMHSYSLEHCINHETGDTLADVIEGDFDIERELDILDERMERYLNSLTLKQRKILKLMSYGYKSAEIKKILRIPNKIYLENLKAINDYERKSILLRDGDYRCVKIRESH